MNIDSIKNGIIIDHIEAKKGMEIYELLHLGDLNCPVAMITNTKSKKMGRKDIIKIDQDMEINVDMIGFIEPNATINVVKNGELVNKYKVELPEKIVNIAKCQNPRCITSVERDLEQIFTLTDKENKVYRCKYCEMSLK
ncbi:MAG: aspartate carbamoyltransferase regulatory subunit [Clostridia bacterium]|nr:aspartate carbamoyltransferase regulatory subunit [Clostridia bacterium]